MFSSFPLCYEAHGDAANPCILLIMGISGQLINWPSRFIQTLVDRGYYVVVYDNRDAGLSKHYDENGTPSLSDLMQGKLPEKYYTLKDMADDAILLLDHLKKSKAHIAGISMGGIIAQLVAINHPDRVESLTCIASTSGEKGLPEATKEVQQFFFAPKSDKEPSKENYVKEKTALYKLYNHPDYFDEEEARNLNERIYDRNHDASGFSRQLVAMVMTGPRTQQLNALDLPALIIHGNYDPAFPIQHGRQLAGAIKGSQLIEIEKFGHGISGNFSVIVADHMLMFYENIKKLRDANSFKK